MKNKRLLNILAIVLALSLTLVACSKDQVEDKVDQVEDKIDDTAQNIEDGADKTAADISGNKVAERNEPIYKTELMDKALAELGVIEKDVIITKAEYELGDVAEFKFVKDGQVHKYYVSYDGTIAKYKTEKLDDVYVDYSYNIDQLFTIALQDSGLNKDDLTKIEISLDDDGEKKVEVSLKTDTQKYEYKINPDTGDILKKEID